MDREAILYFHVSCSTRRHSYSYPYGTAEAYKTGLYGHSASDGPVRTVYTQDFSGTEGHSGYQQGIPVIAAVEKYIVAPIHTSAHGSSTGSWHRVDGQSETLSGDLSGVQFAQEVAGIGAKDFENAALSGTGYGGTKGSTLPKVPTGSYGGSGHMIKSGVHGAGNTAGHSLVSSVQDISKVTGQPHQFKIKPEIQRTVLVSGVTGSQHTSGQKLAVTQKTHGVRQVDGISSIKDQGAITGHSGHSVAEKRPIVTSFDKANTGRVSSEKQSSGYVHRAGSVFQTGTRGSSTAAGPQISFILGGTELYPKEGYRPVSINKLSVPALSVARRPSIVQGSGAWHRTQGITGTGPSGETIFAQGISPVAGQRFSGVKPALVSFDRLPTGGVTGSRKHSSGYAHRIGSTVKSGVSAGVGPQISFTRGETAQRQPGLKPVTAFNPKPTISQDSGVLEKTETKDISGSGQGEETIFGQDKGAVSDQWSSGVKPEIFSSEKPSTDEVSGSQKQSSGNQRVVGDVSKNTQSFSTATGPSRISFTQDFSKVPSHQDAAIKPETSTFKESGVPEFPGKIPSRGYQSEKLDKASFGSKSTQGPSVATKTEKKAVIPQQAFIESDGQSPTHVSYFGSAAGRIPGDKFVFTEGPATGSAEGYALDYKHNISPSEGVIGDRLSSFIIAPETTFANDRRSLLYSYAPGGIQYPSTVVHETGDAITSYKILNEDHFGDKSKLYVAVPADDDDYEKSSITLHSSGLAPSDTFKEEKDSFYQLSPGRADSGTATHDRYESQMPVL